MQLNGSNTLPCSIERAWAALNNPEVLKRCIAGCEQLTPDGEHSYQAVLALRIGPLAARFTGTVRLSELEPPCAYTLTFDGQGGAVGFGKGVAQVRLAPTPAGCELSYTVQAQVGGKIAQIGQRLIDSAAQAMAVDFFARLQKELKGPDDDAIDATKNVASNANTESASPVKRGLLLALLLAAAFAAWRWLR